ncbi:DUF6485 family protein [Aminipila luticellarii]|uniref:Uncharacterized protein n=1 Tax=Aminipila luticellarii TaxID=2507160 RepID=A0A410PV12_9FIRM|nr:DUF6485 family protein [Aminipila luticellarii]QAT42789.1 hypothetical protein EQM06_05835 [Aminipila luticellarii]
MSEHEHFCTCGDKECKFNPRNHNMGCDPCIQKNLSEGEIPSCFFHLVHDDTSELQEFTMGSFVKYYQKYADEKGAPASENA